MFASRISHLASRISRDFAKARTSKRVISLTTALLIFLVPSPQRSYAAIAYDLAADWSDVVNPSGPWSYNGTGGVPLTIHRDDWDSNTNIHFSIPQPAWAASDSNTSVPAWFKSTGATSGTHFNLDFPAGRAGMHGPPDLTPPGMPLGPDEFSSVTWTSPMDGMASLSGGTWLMRKSLGRSMDWTLRVNGARVSGGSLTSTDSFTSSNPFDFAAGDGGSSALNFAVSTGDIVALELGRPTSDGSHEFVGVDFSVSFVPFTDGAMYWTDVDGPPGSHTIKRANLDGTALHTVVDGLYHPRGMTLDTQNGYMYWAEPGTFSIRRAKLDGTAIETVIADAQDGTAAVALDLEEGKMYWTDVDNASLVNGKIRRANLDGSNSEVIVMLGPSHPGGIAVDTLHHKVYWTDLVGNKIQRAGLDGSNVEDVVTGVDEANGLAIDPLAGKIYWPELSTATIQRANLDGTGVETLVMGLGNPTTIGLDLGDGKLYWTDSEFAGLSNRIERANLDGSGREVVVTGVGFPWGIAVVPVPEPSSLALFSLSWLTLGVRRFRLRPPRTQIRADDRSMQGLASQRR